MKIIVSASELSKLQEGMNTVVDKINEIDTTENLQKKDIMEYLGKLKDEVCFKYKLLKGEFVITISEELVTDFTDLYLGYIIKLLPVMKALDPIFTMLMPILGEIKEGTKSFINKYSNKNEEVEVTPTCECTTTTPAGNGEHMSCPFA